MTPLFSQEPPETEFAKVRRIMSEPPTDFDPGEAAPWTATEFSAFAEKEAVEQQPEQDRASL